MEPTLGCNSDSRVNANVIRLASIIPSLKNVLICAMVVSGCQARDNDIPSSHADAATNAVTKPFAEEALVVGGEHGSTVDDVIYLSVDGNPEVVAKGDPVRRAAHFAFVVDQSVNAQSVGSFSGNTPDKFVWLGDYEYDIDGKPFKVHLSIDGRKFCMIASEKVFHLAHGNFFRIKVLPGPTVQVDQLPVVDTLDLDQSKVKAVFDAHSS